MASIIPEDLNDEEYASSEDSDFAPDAVPVDLESESEDSGDEEQAVTAIKAKIPKKRKTSGEDEAEDLGFENSGDEAIIGKAKRRKGKKGTLDEDEGGEGGFVRTRAMKAAEPEERKALVTTTASTIDVNALWTEMISGSLKKARAAEVSIDTPLNGIHSPETASHQNPGPAQAEVEAELPETITIQHSYTFAGKTHFEKKVVPRNSAEAKLYLASQSDSKSNAQPPEPAGPRLRNAPKARRSIFEPVLEHLPQRTDLRYKINSYVPSAGKIGREVAAKKLNTVEKSALDWAGFVDKEGLKDDLETAGKAKGTYLSNQEFLARAEDRREEEARRARLKERGMVV